MKKAFENQISFDDHLGCFGDFNKRDTICKRYCAISLRCTIECEQNSRLELLEELASYEAFPMKMQ